MTVRVLLVDDHPVVREGVSGLLAAARDFEVVGQAECGDEVPALVEQLHPDVVVLDLVMPGRGGLEVTGELTRRFPGARVLVLTARPTWSGLMNSCSPMAALVWP